MTKLTHSTFNGVRIRLLLWSNKPLVAFFQGVELASTQAAELDTGCRQRQTQ
jgi:hypothetical protein